jgi:hypothetical protein
VCLDDATNGTNLSVCTTMIIYALYINITGVFPNSTCWVVPGRLLS